MSINNVRLLLFVVSGLWVWPIIGSSIKDGLISSAFLIGYPLFNLWMLLMIVSSNKFYNQSVERGEIIHNRLVAASGLMDIWA